MSSAFPPPAVLGVQEMHFFKSCVMLCNLVFAGVDPTVSALFAYTLHSGAFLLSHTILSKNALLVSVRDVYRGCL